MRIGILTTIPNIIMSAAMGVFPRDVRKSGKRAISVQATEFYCIIFLVPSIYVPTSSDFLCSTACCF